MIKKLLLIVVAVAVIAVAITLVDQKHQTNKNKTDAYNAQIASDVANIEQQRKDQAIAIQAAHVKEVEALRVECLKGKAAYDKLTATVKTQFEVPDCGEPQAIGAVSATVQ